jgi:hypothetical protein
MTANQIQRFIDVRSFAPFSMHLADRREFVVRHPELVTLSGGGRIVTVRNDEGMDEVVDVLLITSLRPLPALAEEH